VSQSLSRLRVLFADGLFIRRSHGLEPTPRALELAPQIDELLNRFELAIGTQVFVPAQSDRLFRLSAPEYVTAQIAPKLEQTLCDIAPNVTCWYSHLPQQDAFTALSR
jgi:DNA-binding transcriptional LysR family regulator